MWGLGRRRTWGGDEQHGAEITGLVVLSLSSRRARTSTSFLTRCQLGRQQRKGSRSKRCCICDSPLLSLGSCFGFRRSYTMSVCIPHSAPRHCRRDPTARDKPTHLAGFGAQPKVKIRTLQRKAKSGERSHSPARSCCLGNGNRTCTVVYRVSCIGPFGRCEFSGVAWEQPRYASYRTDGTQRWGTSMQRLVPHIFSALSLIHVRFVRVSPC